VASYSDELIEITHALSEEILVCHELLISSGYVSVQDFQEKRFLAGILSFFTLGFVKVDLRAPLKSVKGIKRKEEEGEEEEGQGAQEPDEQDDEEEEKSDSGVQES
jgi:hypothetical protein